MSRKVGIVAVLVLYACLSAVFLVYFNGYVFKPGSQEYFDAHGWLHEPGRYGGEPLVFRPSWLKNYATDLSRFKGFNFSWTPDAPAYWLFSTRELTRAGYEVREKRVFKRLVVQLVVREGAEIPRRPIERPPVLRPKRLEIKPIKGSLRRL
jgi:hypothetical protein